MGDDLRRGNVRRLHHGSGWIVAWPVQSPGWEAAGGRAPVERAESYFFPAQDAADFDALHEGDRVSFVVVEPEPPRGPRALMVRRVDDHD